MVQNKIGIIGTGVGLTHAKIIKQIPEFELVGLCGRNLEKTKNAADSLAIPFATDQVDQILEKSLDSIVIAAPNDLHLEFFKKAVNKVPRIILEKPAGISVLEVEELIQLAKQNNVQVIVNHELRFHPLFTKVQEILTSGQLGKPVLINMSYVHNLFSNPDYRFSWMNQKERGGGQLQLLGTHLLDLTGWWLGFDKECSDISIKKLIAVEKRLDGNEVEKQVNAEDTFALNALWGETIITISNATRGFGYKGLCFEIHCTNGCLLFNEKSGLQLSRKFGEIEDINYVDELAEINTGNGIFPIAMKYFWNALATGTEADKFCTLEQALLVQKIIH